MEKTQYVLWGIKAAYGPKPIKIMGGTYTDCCRAWRERQREGGWGLFINRDGTHPDQYPDGCAARQLATV